MLECHLSLQVFPGVKSFVFFPRFMGRVSPSRGRLARALISLHLVLPVVFPLPALIAEFFDEPLVTEGTDSVTLLAGERVTQETRESVALATIGGTALVNPTPPVTERGRVPFRRQARPLVPVGAQFRVLATGFSSTPDQTDGDPFTTASGTHVHDGTVATNFLPFGTRVRFHNYRPDMVFTVEDRHHPRLSDRVDIWFTSRGEALRFGKAVLEMEIVE